MDDKIRSDDDENEEDKEDNEEEEEEREWNATKSIAPAPVNPPRWVRRRRAPDPPDAGMADPNRPGPRTWWAVDLAPRRSPGQDGPRHPRGALREPQEASQGEFQ